VLARPRQACPPALPNCGRLNGLHPANWAGVFRQVSFTCWLAQAALIIRDRIRPSRAEVATTTSRPLMNAVTSALRRMLAGAANRLPLVGLVNTTSGTAVCTVMLTGAEVVVVRHPPILVQKAPAWLLAGRASGKLAMAQGGDHEVSVSIGDARAQGRQVQEPRNGTGSHVQAVP